MLLPDCAEVHDDWIPEALLTTLVEGVNLMPMYFLNRASRFETHTLDIHWYYPVAVTEESVHGRVEEQMASLQEPLDSMCHIWEILREKIGGRLGLYECAITANTFGTEGHPHFDFRNRRFSEAHYTALVYCCPKWDITWAGETLIFDEHGEISGGVMPKPGRVALLRGDPFHVGRSVSRICPSDRRVLVFKFWDEDILKGLL